MYTICSIPDETCQLIFFSPLLSGYLRLSKWDTLQTSDQYCDCSKHAPHNPNDNIAEKYTLFPIRRTGRFFFSFKNQYISIVHSPKFSSPQIFSFLNGWVKLSRSFVFFFFFSNVPENICMYISQIPNNLKMYFQQHKYYHSINVIISSKVSVECSNGRSAVPTFNVLHNSPVFASILENSKASGQFVSCFFTTKKSAKIVNGNSRWYK